MPSPTHRTRSASQAYLKEHAPAKTRTAIFKAIAACTARDVNATAIVPLIPVAISAVNSSTNSDLSLTALMFLHTACNKDGASEHVDEIVSAVTECITPSGWYQLTVKSLDLISSTLPCMSRHS